LRERQVPATGVPAPVERARAERGVRPRADRVEVDPERRERGAVEVVAGSKCGGVPVDRVGRDPDGGEGARGDAARLVGEGEEQVDGVDGVVAALARVRLGLDDRRPRVAGEAFEHVMTSWCYGTPRTSCA